MLDNNYSYYYRSNITSGFHLYVYCKICDRTVKSCHNTQFIFDITADIYTRKCFHCVQNNVIIVDNKTLIYAS